MVVKSVHQSKHDELNGYEAEQKSIDQLRADYAGLKAEMDKTISEKDEVIGDMRKDIASIRRDNDNMRKDNDNMRMELEEKNKWIKQHGEKIFTPDSAYNEKTMTPLQLETIIKIVGNRCTTVEFPYQNKYISIDELKHMNVWDLHYKLIS